MGLFELDLVDDLPLITWLSYTEAFKTRSLVISDRFE
jgi:hypothetical protein